MCSYWVWLLCINTVKWYWKLWIDLLNGIICWIDTGILVNAIIYWVDAAVLVNEVVYWIDTGILGNGNIYWIRLK